MSLQANNNNTWIAEAAIQVRTSDEINDEKMEMVYTTLILNDYSLYKGMEILNMHDRVLIKDKDILLITDDDAQTNQLAYQMKTDEGYKAYRISDNVQDEEHMFLILTVLLNKFDRKVLLKTSKARAAETLILLLKGSCEYVVKGVIEASVMRAYASKDHEEKMSKAIGFVAALEDRNKKEAALSKTDKSLKEGGDNDDRRKENTRYNEDFGRTIEKRKSKFHTTEAVQRSSDDEVSDDDETGDE